MDSTIAASGARGGLHKSDGLVAGGTSESPQHGPKRKASSSSLEGPDAQLIHARTANASQDGDDNVIFVRERGPIARAKVRIVANTVTAGRSPALVAARQLSAASPSPAASSSPADSPASAANSSSATCSSPVGSPSPAASSPSAAGPSPTARPSPVRSPTPSPAGFFATGPNSALRRIRTIHCEVANCDAAFAGEQPCTGYMAHLWEVCLLGGRSLPDPIARSYLGGHRQALAARFPGLSMPSHRQMAQTRALTLREQSGVHDEDRPGKRRRYCSSGGVMRRRAARRWKEWRRAGLEHFEEPDVGTQDRGIL